MEHAEYKRIVPGAQTAVLLIHGIVGTPNHFRDLVPLIPAEYSVHNLLLEGHGRGVRDFSAASMRGWERQVEAAVEALAVTHARILIAAHSMGTLFAIEQACRQPKIAGLFLLAAPVRLFLKPQMAVNSLKVYANRIKPGDAVGAAAQACYGIAPDRNPLHYLGWIPRYLELLAKIRETRRRLPQLQTPGTAYQSGKDEMVSVRSADELRENSCLQVRVLPRSSHYWYEPSEYSVLQAEFTNFMK